MVIQGRSPKTDTKRQFTKPSERLEKKKLVRNGVVPRAAIIRDSLPPLYPKGHGKLLAART